MPTRIHRLAQVRLPPDLLARWGGIPVTIVADLFQGTTLLDPAIRPLRPLGDARLVGAAVTVRCEPGDAGSVLHAIDVAEAGQVIVVDAGGRPEPAVLGGLLAGAARQRGVAGIVVDGPVRDLALLAGWPDLPVFSRGNSARGPTSMDQGEVDTPVVLGGVTVHPGDLVLGDDDGIVIVPRAQADARIDAAQRKLRAWEQSLGMLAQGASALKVFGVPTAEFD